MIKRDDVSLDGTLVEILVQVWMFTCKGNITVACGPKPVLNIRYPPQVKRCSQVRHSLRNTFLPASFIHSVNVH